MPDRTLSQAYHTMLHLPLGYSIFFLFLVVKRGCSLSLVIQVSYLGVSLTWNLIPVLSLATCMAWGE